MAASCFFFSSGVSSGAFAVSAGGVVGARFDDGSPAIVEHPVGAGKVVIWASTIDAYWTNLPLQPVFLPFVHQVGKYVGRYADSRSSFVAGEVLDISRHGELAAPFLDGRSVDSLTELVLEAPSGARERVTATGANHLVTLGEQGFYELRGRETPVGSGRPIAVNVDPAESDLSHLDPQDVVVAVTAVDGQRVPGSDFNVGTPQDQERRQDEEGRGRGDKRDDDPADPHRDEEALREDAEAGQGRRDRDRAEEHGVAGVAQRRQQRPRRVGSLPELLAEPRHGEQAVVHRQPEAVGAVHRRALPLGGRGFGSLVFGRHPMGDGFGEHGQRTRQEDGEQQPGEPQAHPRMEPGHGQAETGFQGEPLFCDAASGRAVWFFIENGSNSSLNGASAAAACETPRVESIRHGGAARWGGEGEPPAG